LTQKQCARLLKAVVILVAAVAGVVYFAAVPWIARRVLQHVPIYEAAYLPWLIYVLASCIPVYWALAEAWTIFTRIGLDRSFCQENARAMRIVAILAAIEAGYMLLGFAGLEIWAAADAHLAMLLSYHPGFYLIFLFLAFLAAMVSAACGALSMLIRKASRLQEENDLTI
jgi:hypothetical protein